MSIEHLKDEISKETSTYRVRPSITPAKNVEAALQNNTDRPSSDAARRLTPKLNEWAEGEDPPGPETRKLKRVR